MAIERLIKGRKLEFTKGGHYTIEEFTELKKGQPIESLVVPIKDESTGKLLYFQGLQVPSSEGACLALAFMDGNNPLMLDIVLDERKNPQWVYASTSYLNPLGTLRLITSSK